MKRFWLVLFFIAVHVHFINAQTTATTEQKTENPFIKAQKTENLPIATIEQKDVEKLEPTKTAPSGKLNVKTREWGPKFVAIESLFGQATQDRQDLNALRERNINKYFEIRGTPNPNFIDLARQTTEETIDYLKKRIEQTLADLGEPPTKFAIFTMGSMVRDESGLYTDLEIGILVKEKNINVIKYFQKFTQKLADRFFLLGEHPDVGGKGFRMDEANNSPAHLHFFARYACEQQAKTLLRSALEKREFDKIPYQGSRIFIATPEEFAQHVNPNFSMEEEVVPKEVVEEVFEEELKKAKKDPRNKKLPEEDLEKEVKELVKTLLKPLDPREKQISASVEALIRNVRFLYGDKTLFDEYIKQREIYLSGPPKNANPLYDNRRQEIAFLEMKKDIMKYMNKPDSSIVTGTLDKEIDIKRELYRFPEQILTNLGFWHNLPEQNTAKIARLLAEKGVITKEVSDALVKTMNYFIGLRFKKQEICRKQTHAMATTLEEYEEQKEELETELEQLKNQRIFMVQSHSTTDEIEKVDNKISELQSNLIDMKKLKPLEETSILSKAEIDTINTIYLPILKKLYEAAKSFITGNKNAFLEIKLEEPKITPPAQIVPEEKPAVKEQPVEQPSVEVKPILQNLESMVKEGRNQEVIDALENNRIDLNTVYNLAFKYKNDALAKEAIKWQNALTRKKIKERAQIMSK